MKVLIEHQNHNDESTIRFDYVNITSYLIYSVIFKPFYRLFYQCIRGYVLAILGTCFAFSIPVKQWLN